MWQVLRLGTGIQRSDILADKPDLGGDVDLLVMGLDSRLDMQGNALSADLYDKLHSGDSTDGGMNSNVLMYVHIPKDGSAATAFAIPRDDYVDFPGCPSGICEGKIKEAYGAGFEQESQKLAAAGISGDQAHQRARDAGRAQQIRTVEKFLDVDINHFVEVTMIAFLEIAEVVQPITVCVKQDTVDTYSGADFKAGVQQINAEQAVAFVRQRRDTSNDELLFTDLDRSRRQQAFIISLLTQLKSSETLTNPSKINGIVGVAKRNTAIDSGLDPVTLARTAAAMQGGNLRFYTLPIEEFGTSPEGASINVVDVEKIRAMVREHLNPPTASPSPTATPSPTPTPPLDGTGITLNVYNASGTQGAARELLTALQDKGYAAGETGNATPADASEVAYAPGLRAQAQELAAYLGGLPLREDTTLVGRSLAVTIGALFDPPAEVYGGAAPTPQAPTPSPTADPETPVDATGGGTTGPPPTALTQMAGGGIPCVK